MRVLLNALNRLEEGTLAFFLLGLALLAFMEVVSRYVFNHSFTWFEELSRYAGVFLTFLGASLGVKYGTHFSMDYFVTRVSTRTSRLMRLATALISAALFFTVSWMAFGHVSKMYRFGTTSAAMKLPMWVAYLPIALFSLTLAIRFIHQGWLQVRGIVRDEPLTIPGQARDAEEGRS